MQSLGGKSTLEVRNREAIKIKIKSKITRMSETSPCHLPLPNHTARPTIRKNDRNSGSQCIAPARKGHRKRRCADRVVDPADHPAHRALPDSRQGSLPTPRATDDGGPPPQTPRLPQ